ncbi:DUF4175 domain-containing protein [Loigolactobacillus binensis]|uniref:Uncharacterized protein n=1 Tax=Loigolactobacillus binensis TaxID=2559922 RepID=A0ABW3E891_9LACO|nr:DUF4175 domain-containing protein [Loigolactobacillus binensis]
MLRDHLMSAAIFGLFSFVWFGWAQETLPDQWRWPVAIASVIGALLAAFSGYLSYQHWHSATALTAQTNYRWYLIFVLGEFILAGGGAAILLKTQQSIYVAPWISLVVGSHFIALQFIFHDPSLYWLAALMIIVSLLGLFWPTPAKSALVGVNNGIILLAFSLFNLGRFLWY